MNTASSKTVAQSVATKNRPWIRFVFLPAAVAAPRPVLSDFVTSVPHGDACRPVSETFGYRNRLKKADESAVSSDSLVRHLLERRVDNNDHGSGNVQDSLPIVGLVCILIFVVAGVAKVWRAATKRFVGSFWGMEILGSEPSTAAGADFLYTKNYNSPRWGRPTRVNKIKHTFVDGLKGLVTIACVGPKKRGRAEVDSTVKKRDLWSRGWSPIVLPETSHSTLSEIDSSEHNSNIDIEMGTSPFEGESVSPFSIAPPPRLDNVQYKGTTKHKNFSTGVGGSRSFTCDQSGDQSHDERWRRLSCPMEENEVLVETPLALDSSRREFGIEGGPTSVDTPPSMLNTYLGDGNSVAPLSCVSGAGLHQRKERTLSLPAVGRTPSSPIVQYKKALTPCSVSYRQMNHFQSQQTPFSLQGNESKVLCPEASNPRDDTKNDTIGANPRGEPLKLSDELLDEEIRQNPILNVDFNKDVMIEACLGSGSAGVVYRALWRGDQVAVKVLIESCQTPEQLHTFYKEVKVLISLRHPNVVRFLGASMKPPHLCIIQALATHGSLYQMLHIHHVRPEYGNLLHILKDIASAMAYCHSQPKPIVHRDLKTQNILLGDGGKALVADFGLAKVKERTFLQTRHNGAGTVAYMAPETFGGGPVDEKCDVYSFGIIMWECLTGHRPWQGVLPMQAADERMLGRNPGLPPNLRKCGKTASWNAGRSAAKATHLQETHHIEAVGSALVSWGWWPKALTIINSALHGLQTLRKQIMKEGNLSKLGAGLVIFSGEKVLLLRRAPHSKNPETWGLPGGNMDDDDLSLYETALREAKEEMGGYPNALDVAGIITTLRGHHLDKRYDVYIVRITEQEQSSFAPVLNEEHTDWRWFSVLELVAQKNLHPVVKKLITQHRSEFGRALSADGVVIT
ncbi:hypothetical protein BSKO_08667 [Bryopsis sp. KO-2023]|nr:hypothetical protein BSKO_08667 [Bryopsis sp. KO-2023]